MNALEFLNEYGRDEAERVAVAAGTKYAYFNQLAYGHRRPSVELAQELVRASGGRLKFDALLLFKRNSEAA